MKTSILGAVLGITALSGLLVASPAQAKDGVSSARVSNPDRAGAAYAQTTVDFVNRKKVIFRSFKVRDICPADNHGVRARIEWIHTDHTRGYGAWKKDTDCGSHGTNFGSSVRTGRKSIKFVYVKVCISNKRGQHLVCKDGKWRRNQYV